MYEEWFVSKLAPDGQIEDGVHPDEAQALKKLLEKQITAQEAAVAITKPIERSDTPDEDLPYLWGLLQDALIELPSENLSLLLSLLRAIENLPPPNFSPSQAYKVRGYGRFWRGLPHFGHDWSDYYKRTRWAGRKEDFNIDEERAVQIRVAHVEARFVMEGIGGLGDMDWGYEAVVGALERTIKDSVGLDIQVSAAAEWLVTARELFRAGATRADKSWAFRRSGLDLWKGERNDMHWERWYFWKSRLEELKKKGGSIAEAAEKALKSM